MATHVRDMTRVTARLSAFNLAYLALAWVIAFGAIAVFAVEPAWYTFALAFVLVSSRQQALLNLEHEAVHRKLLAHPRLNELVGVWLCAAPVVSPYGAAAARHLTHHRLLATDEDPDRDLYDGEDKGNRRGLIRHFVGGLLGGYAGMVLMGPKVAGASSKTRRRDLVSIVVVQAVIAIALTLTVDWWAYPVLWLAPLGTLTAFCHLIRSFVEHAISDGESPEHANRLVTIRSNWAERSLLSPYFMNYHAEHHIVPSVPAPRLRAMQERLESRPDRPPVLARTSYAAAVRRYARNLPR